jgi:anaerobic ribonucleoside-triphosphate reductase
MKPVTYCKKRDGSVAEFDKKRIVNAIKKAFDESEEGNRIIAHKISESIVDELERLFREELPTVEQIQDLVEETLMNYQFKLTAKKYILYRQAQAENRKMVL